MADIKTICPNCKLEMVVDSSWVGQAAQCPGCKCSFCIAPGGFPPQPPPPPGGFPQQGYPRPPKKNNTVLWIVLGVVLGVVLLLIVGLSIPFVLNSPREKARRIFCASNMKQLMLAVKMYSSDYNDKFPAGRSIDFSRDAWAKSLPAPLDLLVTQGYLTDSPRTFLCPSTDGNKCTYILVSSGFSDSDNSDLPLLFELPSNHGDGYINVGYVDGSVRAVSLPKDCTTLEQVAEFLIKDVSLPSGKREKFMRNVREAAGQLKR